MNISRCLACAVLSFILIPSSVLAQNSSNDVPRQLTPKEEKKRLKKLRKELAGPFKRWLKQDVRYIITGGEKKVFRNLSTGEERENFIEQFWLRRDPTPDTIENEHREEHYRRIAYANARFASGIPGWRADRGRIYITFGPPDDIESHPAGGNYQRPMMEGGGMTMTYPFEIWRYRFLEGIGTNILIEFVDPTMTGEYRMTIDPSEKDALLHIPGAGLTLAEEMGISSKIDRFTKGAGSQGPLGMGGAGSRSYSMFERMEQRVKLYTPPPIKFKDLEAVVGSSIEYNTLPYTVDVQYMRITSDTVLTGITIQFQNKDLVFREEDGLQKSIVHIYGRVTTVTRRLATVFETPVTTTTTTERLGDEVGRTSIFQKSISLTPGMYRLELVLKDIVGETLSTHREALHVPEFADEKLAFSSLILADKIERIPTRSLGTGQFVIGSSKIRPRVNEVFKRTERLGIYMQVYNLGEDEKTNQMRGTINYQVARLDSPDELLLDFTEDISQIRGASPRQVVIEKLLPLTTLVPGEYRLRLKVIDGIKQETLTPSATFKIR